MDFFNAYSDIDYCIESIKNAKQYIVMHYSEPITLSSLASKACLSEEYFSRLFKKETGKNFTEYLFEIRMIRAKKLLLNNIFNINEIADLVGIPNASYFSIQFKRYYGESPKTMREKGY